GLQGLAGGQRGRGDRDAGGADAQRGVLHVQAAEAADRRAVVVALGVAGGGGGDGRRRGDVVGGGDGHHGLAVEGRGDRREVDRGGHVGVLRVAQRLVHPGA